MDGQVKGQMELDEYLKEINRENFDILDYIPTGSTNAVERIMLRFRTGLRDRQMRKLIHFARRRIPILNMQAEAYSLVLDGRKKDFEELWHQLAG